jgi:serine/threonine protein kinase/tetratricopeptide (TPR) repeat protein
LREVRRFLQRIADKKSVFSATNSQDRRRARCPRGRDKVRGDMSESHPTPEDLPTLAGVTSAGGQAAAPAPVAQQSIGKVGSYKITRLIGEGGMGAVYEAEQDQPRRTVALKVIKPGLASPELLRRFAQESQALGRLQHQGIAQIYDAGTADTGYGPQPYFAMEYIRGEGLREYAEKQHLNTRQRLEIIVKVCDAVHHAHQLGLIHRDLKPGNILVDENGQPKILDFGVARVTDSDSQATMQTDVGQLVGTLAYMSPEQVLADPLELDIRSDVYALGVILYELLAGRLPYNISKKLHEALHAIREEDPSKLSSISRAYRGDIETIVAKALEKDKTRRYASAAELGADIMHYLKDEPIVAQPPSTSYQLKKFARRNKGLVIGIAAVFVVLVAGFVASALQAVRATRAEAQAVSQRDRATSAEMAATKARDEAVEAQRKAVAAEGVATEARDKAIEEKKRADTEAAIAKAVSEFMQKNLFEQVTGGVQGGASQDLGVSGALDRAAAKVDGMFDKQPLVEAGVREAVANAYVSLSLYAKAEPQVERALALRRRVQGEEDRDVLKASHILSGIYANQRKFAESTALLTRTLDIQKRNFGPEHVDTLQYTLALAAIYRASEQFDKAMPFARTVAETRRRTLGPDHKDSIIAAFFVADLYDKVKDQTQALAWASRAHESARRTLSENDPTALSAKAVFQGLTLKATPNAPIDRAARNEVLETSARSLEARTASSLPEMIQFAASRADLAIRQNQPVQAEAVLLEAIDAARRAGQDEPNMAGLLVGAYAMQMKFAEAESTLKKVLENPASKTMNQNIIGFALRTLAEAYRRDGRLADAEVHLVRLVPLSRVVPGEADLQARLDMFQLALNYVSLRKYSEAEVALRDLLQVQRRVSGPEIVQTVATIANIGWVRLQQKRYPEAEQSFREARAILTRTAAAGWERFNVDGMLGASLASQKKYEEAELLLITGYEGMATAPRATNASNTIFLTREQVGEALVQLYIDWGKPAKQAEWSEKLKASKPATP